MPRHARTGARWLARSLTGSMWAAVLIRDWCAPLGYTGLIWLYPMFAAAALFLAIEGWRHAHAPFPALAVIENTRRVVQGRAAGQGAAGRSPGAIPDTLMPYARADGHNDGKRRSLLGLRGAEEIEYLDVFQGLLLPPTNGVHRAAIARPDRRAAHLELAPIDLAARRATMTRVREGSDTPRWTYRVRADGVAVLDMPTGRCGIADGTGAPGCPIGATTRRARAA